MDLPKRTESRPPRPPVPKFRLIGAGTDTPDFLPPPKSEESFQIAWVQDNLSETSSEDSQDGYFARKRLQAIVEEMNHQILVLGLSQDLLKTAIKLLKPELLEGLKQKKYNAIAIAALIAAVKITCQPITQKEIFAKTQVSEKQIKKILLQFHSSYDFKQVVNSFMKSIIAQLGLNDKFYDVCCKLLIEIIKKQNLIQGEHENVIAAAIVKYVGDFIFDNRGGLIPQLIANLAKCTLGTYKLFEKKLIENSDLLEFLQKLMLKD